MKLSIKQNIDSYLKLRVGGFFLFLSTVLALSLSLTRSLCLFLYPSLSLSLSLALSQNTTAHTNLPQTGHLKEYSAYVNNYDRAIQVCNELNTTNKKWAQLQMVWVLFFQPDRLKLNRLSQIRIWRQRTPNGPNTNSLCLVTSFNPYKATLSHSRHSTNNRL